MTVHPRGNGLALVYRDMNVDRFVKYINHRASNSDSVIKRSSRLVQQQNTAKQQQCAQFVDISLQYYADETIVCEESDEEDEDDEEDEELSESD